MTQLRIIETAKGRGLTEIRCLVNGQPSTIAGKEARELMDEASASMGLMGDLPAVIVEFLKLQPDQGQDQVDAEWMTKEERLVYESNKLES